MVDIDVRDVERMVFDDQKIPESEVSRQEIGPQLSRLGRGLLRRNLRLRDDRNRRHDPAEKHAQHAHNQPATTT
jgi:hypothetical protein